MFGCCLAKPPMAIIPFKLYGSPTWGNLGERIHRSDERPCVVWVCFWITHPGKIIVRGIGWPSVRRHLGRIHVVVIRSISTRNRNWLRHHLLATWNRHGLHSRFVSRQIGWQACRGNLLGGQLGIKCLRGLLGHYSKREQAQARS